jgi:hypothetical protein
MQYDFGYAPRPKLALSEIEAIIKKHRILTPCPSRQTLTEWCEEGVLFEATRIRPNGMWYVFEDSFQAWVKSLQTENKFESARGGNQTRLAA